jgi:hypothetical protein
VAFDVGSGVAFASQLLYYLTCSLDGDVISVPLLRGLGSVGDCSSPTNAASRKSRWSDGDMSDDKDNRESNLFFSFFLLEDRSH